MQKNIYMCQGKSRGYSWKLEAASGPEMLQSTKSSFCTMRQRHTHQWRQLHRFDLYFILFVFSVFIFWFLQTNHWICHHFPPAGYLRTQTLFYLCQNFSPHVWTSRFSCGSSIPNKYFCWFLSVDCDLLCCLFLLRFPNDLPLPDF